MIDLNAPEFDQKHFLTKENILNYVNEYSIYRHYLGAFVTNNIMSSPFRKDRSPSFGVFYSKKYTSLLFKDLARGISGDCFSLLTKIVYPAYTRAEAMAQVVIDFGISDKFVLPRPDFTKSKADASVLKMPSVSFKEIKPIGIRARAYTVSDYRFWLQFGITRGILKLYNVVPITHFSYGNNVFAAEEYAYAYIERKDGLTTYKIYQPFSQNIKFFTDMDASIHAGYTQLPAKGVTLLITKSLKDVMSIREVAGIPSVSVLSETVFMKPKVIEEYQERFEDVIVFFDNDKAGQKMAEEYRKQFGLPNIEVPKAFKNSKDFSDVVKHTDSTTAKNFLDNAVWLEKNKALNFDDLPF